MDRRRFLKNGTAAAAAVGLGSIPLQGCSNKMERTITFLHTNDVHSHIETFGPTHSRYPNLGGVARRATLIEQVRNENPNTLLFDAGDIFQGTPYFNFFGGEIEFKMMSKLGYDAATIGNHDFDNGIDGLDKQLPNAQFDFIISNYDFRNTVLDGKTKSHEIFIRDGIKIGVFGLGIELQGLVDPHHYKETKHLDPFEICQDMSQFLKHEKGCDLVICLSHLGYYYKRAPEMASDLAIAKRSKDVDLIIGGHSHTFLKKPTVVKNANDKNMLVNQVGCWGVNVGRIDFTFDDAGNVSSKGAAIIV